MARSSPRTELSREDLPTLGRPMIARRIASWSSSEAGSCAGKRGDDRVEQIADAAAVDRRNRVDFAQAQPVELGGVHLQARVVGLVDDHEQGLRGGPENVGDLEVRAGHAVGGIDHEEDHIGLRHGDLGLRAHLLRQRIGLVQDDPAGVDDGELDAAPLDGVVETVAGDAGRVFDDRRRDGRRGG